MNVSEREKEIMAEIAAIEAIIEELQGPDELDLM